MKSCPCCGKTPNCVVTRTMRAEDNKQGIMVDALICPACQAIIGVTIGADDVSGARNAWDAAVATYPRNPPRVWNKAAVRVTRPSSGEKPADHEYVKVDEPVRTILEGIGQRVERLSIDLEMLKARVGRAMEEDRAAVQRRHPQARSGHCAQLWYVWDEATRGNLAEGCSTEAAAWAEAARGL